MREDENPTEDLEAEGLPEELAEVGEPGYEELAEERGWEEGVALLEPDPGDLGDELGEEIGEEDPGGGRHPFLSPEESAVHLRSEEVADDLDPAAERAEYLEGR